MAFSDTLQLDDASGDLTSFTRIHSSDPKRVRRVDAASTLAEPVTMEIAHDSVVDKRTGVVTDRHLVSFARFKIVNGVKMKQYVNISVGEPQSTGFTSTDGDDLMAFAIDFLSGGSFSDSGIGSNANLVALRRGES